MVRIERQGPKSVEFGKRVLSWIICAKRPLTTSEPQHALAVDVGEPRLDKYNLPQVEDMVSVCAGFVTIDEESRIIRLVHYTAQEYFQRTQEQWFPNAQLEKTSVCTTYLSFSDFEGGHCETDIAFEERLREHKLYDYAAHNWGHHARDPLALCTEVVNFLNCEKKVEASNQARMVTKFYSSHSKYSQEFPKRTSGLHLAAYSGIKKTVKELLQEGAKPNTMNSNGRTPLSWAAEEGYEEVVKLLLEKGADLDCKDNKGRTPLSWAGSEGHKTVVQLLLEKGVDPEPKATDYDINGFTPLFYTARNGHKAVAELLLEKGVNPDSKSYCTYKYNRNRTPLSFAAEYEHEAVAQLLLA